MNKVILMGRLTRDPEIRRTADSQTVVGRFSIAVDRKFKREGEPDADFFNCTTFNKQAEFVERYLHKGTKIVVVGRIQNDNYQNNQGQMVYSVRVMVDEIEFAESKSASMANNGGSNYSGAAQSSNDSANFGANDGFMNLPDDDEGSEALPFN